METTEICSGVDYRFPWLLNAQKTQWTGIFSWPFEWSMMMTNFIESPCRRTVILKQMAEVGNAVVYKTARRNVSAINFGWMPNASFKRRKKGCQITQYGVCLALLDETFSHELIAWCEMHSGSNLCKMILHPRESVHRFELLATSRGERQCLEMLLPRRMMLI